MENTYIFLHLIEMIKKVYSHHNKHKVYENKRLQN
jgi:hypothetical protein